MHPLIARICGIIGLLLIISGIISKSKKREDEFYILGGLMLFVYSSYLRDLIFMSLQAIFVIVAFLDLLKRSSKRKR